MGTKSHLEPEQFAEQLRGFLWEQIEPLGADKSGRWLEAATGKARSREYWRKILAGVQAMTTNDVQVIAECIFEQSPYEFVRAVRDWAEPAASNVIPLRQHGTPADDDGLRRVAYQDTTDEGIEH